jgi:hypothetical protein
MSREMDKALEVVRKINHPLTDAEILSDRMMWIPAAMEYLHNYTGDFSFLRSLKQNVTGINPRGLSIGQVRGVVNCMRAEAQRAQREITRTQEIRNAQPSQPAQPTRPVVNVTKEIPDGYYTVAFEGGHRTFRVQTDERATWVAFLSGSNNESDYTSFARIIDGKLLPFKRWTPDSTVMDCVKVLFTEDLTKLGKAYAARSGKCYVCNRTLTTPESIEAGICPICQSKRFGG